MTVKELKNMVANIPREYDDLLVVAQTGKHYEAEPLSSVCCIGHYTEREPFDEEAAIPNEEDYEGLSDEEVDSLMFIDRCNALGLGYSTGFQMKPEDKVEFRA